VGKTRAPIERDDEQVPMTAPLFGRCWSWNAGAVTHLNASSDIAHRW